MNLSVISLVILIAMSVVSCAKQKEICSCVPLNICPDVNRFSKEDAKYFKTILKCKERGFVRCCLNNEGVRRSDNAENVILIDDVQSAHNEIPAVIKDVMKEENEAVQTTESFTTEAESTTVETQTENIFTDLTTTEDIDEATTMESLKLDEDGSESKRKSKFIDNSISVIYPNHENFEADEKKKAKAMEHLFLIFPNGEIEAALANDIEPSTQKPMKRVIVRKRLIKKVSDQLEEAESKILEYVVEPKQMDIEEVKRRLSDMYNRNKRIRNPIVPTTTTTTTTEASEPETTVKQERRTKIKFRQQKRPTKAIPLEHATTTLNNRQTEEDVERTTKKSRRKIIYDTSSRTNFLKRPSSQQSDFDDDEPSEPEVNVAVSTEQPTESTTQVSLLQTIFTTTPKAENRLNKIDFEHKAMIEMVHKTLSAIHAGVDMKFVEKMIEKHRTKMQEIQKQPPTTVGPSKPYRGSARFRKPATTQPIDQSQSESTGTRTRNISRTRTTTVVPTVRSTIKPVRQSPSRTFNNPIMSSNALILEDVDMPPKQKPPMDFRPSPLYGLTMDRHNEFDTEMIEKIHETMKPSANVQNGFFPVIQNGTPSTLL